MPGEVFSDALDRAGGRKGVSMMSTWTSTTPRPWSSPSSDAVREHSGDEFPAHPLQQL